MSEHKPTESIQNVVRGVLDELAERAVLAQARRREEYQHRIAKVYRRAGKSLFWGTFLGTLFGCAIVGFISYKHHFCQRGEAGKTQ